MAWTITRGSTQQIKLCKDEPSEQQLPSGLLQSTQGIHTRKRPHIQQVNMRSHDEKQEDMGGEDDDVGDELAISPGEKKRRLTADQVKFLEMSFSMDLKLEPQRKSLIAKQLGLRPRQVAIWFQNRRARWKNKQLEHDFEALKVKYEAAVQENNSMVKQNEALLEENKRLQAEVAHLKVLMQGGRESGAGVAAMDKTPSPDSDSESGTVKEQKSEMVASSPAKSEDQSEVQDSCGYITSSPCPMKRGSSGYATSFSCPIIAEATVVALQVDAPTMSCTAVKFEPAEEHHLALSPSEELLGLVNNPWVFQQIATGYQFQQHMEDLSHYYSSSDHHLYGWGCEWHP